MARRLSKALVASLAISTPWTSFVLAEDTGWPPASVLEEPATEGQQMRLSDVGEEDDRLAPVFTSTAKFQEPVQPAAPLPSAPRSTLPPSAAQFAGSIFSADGIERSQLSQYRRGMTFGPGTDLVFGSEGKFRVTTDGANLLGKSLSAPGVRTQERSPIVTDPRIRGSQSGRTSASGSYWAPARQDLDTILSKIDSGLIGNILVVKGPYSSMFGPGYDFIDYQLIDTPRYEGQYESYASTSIEYGTNGQQIYGRQSVWGGADNYGFRVSYGHRTANDYMTGNGSRLPSSYNSRDLNLAFGYDFSPDSHLEFNYLRLDQTGVEFPGLVFDINYLVTDGFDLKYRLDDQPEFDSWTIDTWYNRTRFAGDTSRTGKNLQIPTIRSSQGLGPTQFLVTDVDGMSAGYRTAMTWGVEDEPIFTAGTDLIRIGQQLNDLVPPHTDSITLPPPIGTVTFPVPLQNQPIPRSNSIDIGLFVEHARPVSDIAKIRCGGRVDFAVTNARNNVPDVYAIGGFPPTYTSMMINEMLRSELEQHFTPWNVFITGELQLTEVHKLNAGVGHARRPPTLTELYAVNPFIGSLNSGLTFVTGDPTLQMEKNTQFDLGLRAEYDSLRMGLQGFHSIIHDYVTFDNTFASIAFVPGQDFQGVTFTNTDLATLSGFEFTAEKDLTDQLSGFVVMDYVQGTDHTRNKPSRLAALNRQDVGLPAGPRSIPDPILNISNSEPLPGISPLQARVGARLHEAAERPNWMVELEARMVDQQNRVAASLFEQQTPGFTVFNLRGFYRYGDRFTIFSGVENFTNRYYREHLDYRSGLGVFRPGVNFYATTEFNY